MGTRTVRLDNESERILEEIVSAKRLTVSAALKQGLVALRESLAAEGPVQTPYAIYRAIELGDGGAPTRARFAKRELGRLLKQRARR